MIEQAKLFASNGVDDWSYLNNEGKNFYKFLVDKKLAEPIYFEEVWLGDYAFSLDKDNT